MTDDLRDVLRRCEESLTAVLTPGAHKPLNEAVQARDDARRLLAADEDAMLQEEAKHIFHCLPYKTFLNDKEKSQIVESLARELKARDARRKEAGK